MSFTDSLLENGVAIIGAGNMGSGIAQKIAQEGIPVFLFDRTSELAENGKKKVASLLEEGVRKKLFDPKGVEIILKRITCTSHFSDIKSAALVIEAVFEDRKIKEKLFSELNATCSPETIFATNTSSLSVTDLSASSGRVDRFGGLHFFYHPAKNRLLEVIPGNDTSKETENALWQFSRMIKKVSIRTSDQAGFAVNRFFVPWLNESVRMLEDGTANLPTIEKCAMETFGCGMGPFELMNITGIPIAKHAASFLGEALGEFYLPARLLVKQSESNDHWSLEGEADKSRYESVKARLLGCVFYLASKLVDEKVAKKEDIDRGAVVGLRWKLGPFQLMNEVGTKKAFELVKNFVSLHKGISCPDDLEKLGNLGKPWPLSYIDFKITGSNARIIFNRPEAMNALNPAVVAELSTRVEEAIQSPSVKNIIFEGVGKAFVAGADITFFVDALDAKNFPVIFEFTKQGQELFKRISNSGKKTIAFVNGLALGGGFELALSCNKIVVGPDAAFALPETGIGIYPGLGGTQRLSRKTGKALARYLTFTGQMVKGSDACSVGIADGRIEAKDLIGFDEAAFCQKIVECTQCGSVKPPQWSQLADLLFGDPNFDSTLMGKLPETLPPEAAEASSKVLKTLSFKAPIAIRLSSALIELGSKVSLDEGLALELAHLKEIFSTKDAYEGLSSVGARRPVYKGE